VKTKKTILIAPLCWGLGHATRCIPIINALLARDFEVIVASDGEALALLKKEFTQLTFEILPSYGISYSEDRKKFKSHLVKQGPQIMRAIKEEQKITAQLVTKYMLNGIISDNRYGVRHPDVPSVVITHQLRVLSGSTTWLSAIMQKKMLQKFNAIWVPDFKDKPNLSGALGHVNSTSKNVNYLGPISRFKNIEAESKYDLLVLLSGPEPQREILEQKLFKLLENSTKRILFVRGVVGQINNENQIGAITLIDFMTSAQLELAINQSKIIICRSGYTSLMDLAALQKKAFLIPTPGQYEQEYLAEYLQEKKMLPFAKQEEFTLEALDKIELYKGLPKIESEPDYENLFRLF